MPDRKRIMRMLGVTAMLVAALGLGVFVGAPEAAQAQEDTTTTTPTEDTTDTTVDDSSDSATETDRPARGDHDCGDRAESGSTDDSSETTTSSQT
jgi:hypothetical protein